ncbi:MAG: hypothetical protein LBT24_06710 [Tannerella sp.]|jgi:hypothetical protein|nr:hypothetical protein [Tannerella sp.]
MSRLFNFYRIFIITITLFLVCIASHVNAADSDNFSLTIGKGKPAAAPSPAAVNETVTFNFAVSLFNSQNIRIEAVPAEVKNITYTVTSCSHGQITKNVPNMVISTDKKSATGSARHLYSSVISVANFSQTGEHSLTLSVTVIFNDNSTLSGSLTIKVDVVNATFTAYAKGPDKIVFLTGLLGAKIPATVMNDPANPAHDFIGHSFWKCEVDQSLLSSQSQKNLSGHKYGYYPQNPMPRSVSAIITRAGEVRNDDTHSSSASKSYQINVDNAKDVLNGTASLLNSSVLLYNILGQGADNCTAKCVSMCGTAGTDAPGGEGRYAIIINETDTIGIGTVFSFPNPYHHAIQLGSSQ